MPSTQSAEPWRRRLYIPSYRIGEAARYARTSPQTVANWHKVRGTRPLTLTKREPRSEISYLQLIEVGVVAAMRDAGITLAKIREAREYIANEFQSEHPFAEYRFKTDGKQLFIEYDQITGTKDSDKLLAVNKRGQLAWTEILRQRLKEFEYEGDHIVIRWKVAGAASPVVVDPRISFGTPSVKGIATWLIKERWIVGESIDDIATDFDITGKLIVSALKFEDITPDYKRENLWVH